MDGIKQRFYVIFLARSESKARTAPTVCSSQNVAGPAEFIITKARTGAWTDDIEHPNDGLQPRFRREILGKLCKKGLTERTCLELNIFFDKK